MIKLLIGGSPCTYWSIAKKNNRETEAHGMGWELFKNYLIAREIFKPDYFLYENNKSASAAIKQQISDELGVDLMYINSALVSAQNRERFYAFNREGVRQPKDRGILLRDILESGIVDKEKSYCLTHIAGNARDYFKKHHTQVVFEPIRIGTIESNTGTTHDSKPFRVYSPAGKATALIANGGGVGAKTGLYAVPINTTKDGKAQALRTSYYKDGIRNLVGNDRDKKTCVAVPIANYEVANYEIIDGAEIIVTDRAIRQADNRGTKQGKYIYLPSAEKSNTISAGQAHNEKVLMRVNGGGWKNVYRVIDGYITIKGKPYPINLTDGDYIIRKLTPIECERLQTLPDNYTAGVSDTQRYKCLGNGWTAEVIIHILEGLLRDVSKHEKIVVLSMYDGIATGRYCLDKMGFDNVEYYAYEIDKYAIQIAMKNYPDIIQCGDAFQVRNGGAWEAN